MVASMKNVFAVGAFAMLLMTTLMPMAIAVDCPTAVRSLAPCLSFLQSNGQGIPAKECCNGVQSLARMAKTSLAKQQICKCLKPQLSGGLKANDAAITNLPLKCKAGLGFKVSKNINCDKL